MGVCNPVYREAGLSEEVTHDPGSEWPGGLAMDKRSILADRAG